MLVAAVIALLIVLPLIGAGAALALAALAVTALLVAVGILTTSGLVGLAARRPRVAFQALFLQLAVAAAVPAGAAVGWLLAQWLELPLSGGMACLAGGLVGLTFGLLLGIFFNYLWGAVLDEARRKGVRYLSSQSPADQSAAS